MIGTKLFKGKYTNKEYADLACWCNANNATIEDKGEYYEVVEIPAHIPTPEEIKQELINGIQAYMNTTAQTKGYDDIFTAISYENSEDEIFKAEGKACRVWRDKVWRACYNILDEVLAGTRDIPTLEELITELPKIDW
jgi:hypothetical protein